MIKNRTSPENPDRDPYGHFISRTQLFGPGRHTNEVNEFADSWEQKDPGFGSNLIDLYDFETSDLELEIVEPLYGDNDHTKKESTLELNNFLKGTTNSVLWF